MHKEIFLKTVFSCMACDGNIANEEIQLVKDLVSNTDIFNNIDVERTLNSYVKLINTNGQKFLSDYLNEVKSADLIKEEQILLINLALKVINSDNIIEYSEVKFFKKIRSRLSLNDEEILEYFPDIEDFLEPDINVGQEPEWDNVLISNISFENIKAE